MPTSIRASRAADDGLQEAAEAWARALQTHGVLIVFVFGRHFVVLYGYDPDSGEVNIFDPLNGNHDKKTIQAFSASYHPGYYVPLT